MVTTNRHKTHLEYIFSLWQGRRYFLTYRRAPAQKQCFVAIGASADGLAPNLASIRFRPFILPTMPIETMHPEPSAKCRRCVGDVIFNRVFNKPFKPFVINCLRYRLYDKIVWNPFRTKLFHLTAHAYVIIGAHKYVNVGLSFVWIVYIFFL